MFIPISQEFLVINRGVSRECRDCNFDCSADGNCHEFSCIASPYAHQDGMLGWRGLHSPCGEHPRAS